MAGYERWPCRRIARQRGWVEIDKNEGGGYKNEEKKRKRGREGKMKRGAGGRKEMGGGGGRKLVPNFSLSVLGSSTGTDVVSFINRHDSTTDERKTCSYAICHGDGILLKLTKR